MTQQRLVILVHWTPHMEALPCQPASFPHGPHEFWLQAGDALSNTGQRLNAEGQSGGTARYRLFPANCRAGGPSAVPSEAAVFWHEVQMNGEAVF